MDIIVVGAGIGGLAAAVSLSKQNGNSITVYERASKITEIGAGIQITPNASKQLLKWGLGAYLPDLTTRTPCFKARRWSDGQLIGQMDTENHTQQFGGPYIQVHRADLQLALLKCAVDHGVNLKTGCSVVDYDFDSPCVILADGQRVKADFVIAADGIKSVGRRILCGVQSLETIPIGLAVVRATLPVKQIVQHEGLKHLVSEPGINIWVGPGRHAIAYLMRGESVVNLVFEYPEQRNLVSWEKKPYQYEVQANFQGWDSNIQILLSMIQTDTKWSLRYSSSVDKLCAESGKFILLGDAAHVVPSFLAQGAAMAIEDAALLPQVTAYSTAAKEFALKLKEFEHRRMARKMEVQRLSFRQLRLYDLEDGEEQKQRDGDECSDPELVPIWRNREDQEWVYGYEPTAL